MKKTIALMLCLGLAVGSVACGSTSADSSADATSEAAATEAAADETVANPDDVQVELTEPITIQFWENLDNETYDADVQRVVDSFNETIGADMGITVEMTVQSGGIEALETNLVAAIKAGTGVPNVISTEATYVPDYLQADAIVDLTPYVNHAKYGVDLTDYYDIFVDTSSSYPTEGMYTLPAFVSGEVMYYNVDYFEENGLSVPTTWDEMVDVATTITEKEGHAAFGWDDPLKTFTTLATQAGAGYTDKDGNILFGGDNLDKAIDAVSWYKEQIDAGIFRTAGSDYYFSGPFGRQEVYMYIGSGNEAQFIQYKFPEGGEFNWACAPIPQGKEGWDGQNADYSEGFLLAMMDLNDDMQARWASWLFMQYFENADSVKEYTSSGAFLPYLKSVAESEDWQAAAGTAQIAGVDQMDSFYMYYGFEGASVLRSDTTLAMQNILDNGADITETLTNLANSYSK